ncbi:hypothetical protein [Pantoea dispersa]|uniref:hypothetical protein n=1 Tax=Pantoea dispersa TaxID=59814 RepID=UPI00285F308F|nr:hypothetical protein [Pantoea dispersa]MDR6297757.1 hypothetical protein [Pantoea dispersa]
MDNSQGLVEGYVKEVRQLAAKHQMGEDLTTIKLKVDHVIARAHEHFAGWVNGTPEENWEAFGGKMRFLGSSVGDRAWADILAYAGESVKSKEPPHRKN